MNERYSKLFSLPGTLYSPGAPVIISAGALSKDNQTGQVLIQLKLQNITPKTIKAVKVQLQTFDSAGRPLDPAIEYQYLDLNVDRDTCWGNQTPITAVNASARSFSPSVVEVIFSDRKVWTATGKGWDALPSPIPLQLHFKDLALTEQYRVQFGEKCSYFPVVHQDLWLCACGAINHIDEVKCHQCGLALQDLQSVNAEDLQQASKARIAAERQQEQLAQQKQAIADAQRKKKMTMIAIGTAIVVVLLVAILLIVKETGKSRLYLQAVSMAEAGDYESALDAFASLGSYKDSETQYQAVCKQVYPFRVVYNYVEQNGEAITNARLPYDIVSISNGYRYCIQEDGDESSAYFYVDESNQDKFYFVTHSALYAENVESIDTIYTFEDGTVRYYAAITQTSAPNLIQVSGSFAITSYKLGDMLSPDFIVLDDQLSNEAILLDAYGTFLSQWTGDLFRGLDPVFEGLGIDTSLHDLGFENL